MTDYTNFANTVLQLGKMTFNYNFIAIEGNIGAGKTSLATRFAAEFNARLILEQFEENTFLPKFYENPVKYAFPLELTFLAERYQQLKDQLSPQDMFKAFTVADYFIHKSLIFASRNLSGDELTLYTRLFNIIEGVLPKPDLLIYLYLDIDNLKRNIKDRGRVYEQNIQSGYLEKIQQGYLDFLRQQHKMRILIIDTNQLDFVNLPDDYYKILEVMTGTYEPGVHRITIR